MAKTTKTLSEKMETVKMDEAMFTDVETIEMDIPKKKKKKISSSISEDDNVVDIMDDDLIENIVKTQYTETDEYADLARKAMYLNTANLVGTIIQVPYLKFVNIKGVIFKDNIMSESPLCTNKNPWEKKMDFRKDVFKNRFLGCLGIQVLKNWNEYRDNLGIYGYPKVDKELGTMYASAVSALNGKAGDLIDIISLVNGNSTVYTEKQDELLIKAASTDTTFTVSTIVDMILMFSFSGITRDELEDIELDIPTGELFNAKEHLEIIGDIITMIHEKNKYSTGYKYFCKANPSLIVSKWVEFTNNSIAAIRHLAFLETIIQNKQFTKTVTGTFLVQF